MQHVENIGIKRGKYVQLSIKMVATRLTRCCANKHAQRETKDEKFEQIIQKITINSQIIHYEHHFIEIN